MSLVVISSSLRTKLVVLFILGFYLTGHTQVNYVTGTAVDDATYDFDEQFDITQYTVSLPQVYSLNQFVPKVGNQLKYPHDIAWSVASATTIVDAVYSGEFIKENSISELRSPYFVNMLWAEELNPCEDAMSLSRTVERLRDTGIPKLQDYVNLCPSSKDTTLLRKAAGLTKYRYEKVFDREVSSKEKVYRLKTKVSLDHPVIISFHCPQSFANAKEFWSPKEEYNESFPLHSVVVIGYDDDLYGGSFQILNSWSKRWGDGGYMWIRYEDVDFIRYGYSVGYKARDGSNLTVVQGELNFNDAITNTVLPFVRFNPRGFYEFSVGRSDLQFNLTGTLNKPFYLKMYYKSGDEVVRIYPMDSWKSALFEYSFMQFDIPGDRNYYTIEKDMFASIFVFISMKKIDDVDFTDLVRSSETIYDVLFNNEHIFTREVIWDNDQTHFYSRLYDEEIIPLIIGLEFN